MALPQTQGDNPLTQMFFAFGETAFYFIWRGDYVIALGSDHGGFHLKQEIISYLESQNIEYKDYGTYDENATDYPIFAKAVCEKILDSTCEKGVLICGTGIGISISANRYKGIRAALCHDTFSAKACRTHNNANVLAMGERVIGVGLALDIVHEFLNTDFSEGPRHIERIRLIEEN